MDEKKLTETPDGNEAPSGVPEADKGALDDAKMREDIALLRSLFPALKPEEIPDEVWDKVAKGESLAAAYALFFLIRLKEKERIEETNHKNEQKAPPRIKKDHTEEE